MLNLLGAAATGSKSSLSRTEKGDWGRLSPNTSLALPNTAPGTHEPNNFNSAIDHIHFSAHRYVFLLCRQGVDKVSTSDFVRAPEEDLKDRMSFYVQEYMTAKNMQLVAAK